MNATFVSEGGKAQQKTSAVLLEAESAGQGVIQYEKSSLSLAAAGEAVMQFIEFGADVVVVDVLVDRNVVDDNLSLALHLTQRVLQNNENERIQNLTEQRAGNDALKLLPMPWTRPLLMSPAKQRAIIVLHLGVSSQQYNHHHH